MIPDEQMLRLIFQWRVDVANMRKSTDDVVHAIADGRENDANDLESILIKQAQVIQ